jgi:RecA/RadA recombinase
MALGINVARHEPWIYGNNKEFNMSLMEKLKKNSTIKETAILSESKFFDEGDKIQTSVPAFNVALSGELDGGYGSGLTVIAGPSKHFKTSFTLLMMKAYLDKHKDAIALFYDSEFGSPQSYFESFGIDPSRVLHTPVANIEELKFDIMSQMKEVKRGDKIFIALDSAGNIASKKEVDDALEGKSVADMSRAKQLKSLFRMITPELTIKQLPMVVVNHTYQTQEMYSKTIVSGGTGIYYSANTIFVIGRQQEKDGTEVAGYNFVINVEKSRFSREKSKIPVTVMHDSGISKWSGLLDMALESKHVVKPSNGWYSRVDGETGEVEDKKFRMADTNTSEFWGKILKQKTFRAWVKDTYQVANGSIMSDSSFDDALDGVLEEAE